MIFEHVFVAPDDPILSLMARFHQDPRPGKVNLSIGFYYGEDGQVPVLPSVRAAKVLLDAKAPQANLYLPMDGDPAYRNAVQRLLFDEVPNAVQGRIVTVQSVGGSGAIRVGADLLRLFYPAAQVWVSDPTWDNHLAIFDGAGFEVRRYPYLDSGGTQIDFGAMLALFDRLPAHSIVLLHACCHNPTGLDLADAQWDELFQLFKARRLIPFLDAAYLGLGAGFEQDTYALRALARAGITGLVSNSFSKIFSLYGERVGSLSVVCESAEIAEKISGQLKRVIRANYANPPRFGAQLVSQILQDHGLRQQWLAELQRMRARLLDMRERLSKALETIAPEIDTRYLRRQKGMFSFTGLNAGQVDRIRERYGVYLIHSGRMCIAGLNASNLEAVAMALANAGAMD